MSGDPEGRDDFLRDNAAAVVRRLEQRIERYKRIVTRLEESRASMRAEIQRLREGATSGVTLDEAYDIAEKIAEDYTGLHVGHEKQEVMTEQLVKRIARSIYEPKAEIPPEDAA